MIKKDQFMLFLRAGIKPCASLHICIGRKPATEMERSGIEVHGGKQPGRCVESMLRVSGKRKVLKEETV